MCISIYVPYFKLGLIYMDVLKSMIKNIFHHLCYHTWWDDLLYFIINHIWNILWFFFFFCYHHLPCHILQIKHELKVLSWTISPRKWSWVRLSSTQNPTNQIFFIWIISWQIFQNFHEGYLLCIHCLIIHPAVKREYK